MIFSAESDAPSDGQSIRAKEQLEAWKQRLDTTLHAEQSLLRQLYTIEAEQSRQEAELAKINAHLEQVRSEVAAYQEKINLLTEDRDKRSKRVSDTMRRLYKLGRGGLWQVLFESPDLKTFLKRYKALKVLLENDLNVVTGYKDKVRRLAAARADLARDVDTLARLRNDAVSRRTGIWLEREKRMVLLEQIQRNKTLAMRATRELEAQDQKIATTIQSMPNLGQAQTVAPSALVLDFATRKGYLKIPTQGAVVEHFGRQVSHRFGTVTKNNGIDIAASEGSSVRVVADGTVRYVGEFLGYGKVVIVDHGDRYHTLYAHLTKFLVQKGDGVKAGTVIGAVGKSGSLTESRLHFEIRHMGTALDPLQWLDLTGAKEDQ